MRDYSRREHKARFCQFLEEKDQGVAQRLGVQLPRAPQRLSQKHRSCARSGQLQRRVGRARLVADHVVIASIIPRFIWYRAWLCARATRRAQSRRAPAAVCVPASVRRSSATGVRLHRSRSGPRGASHSHFLMCICAYRAAWCATGIVWPQRLLVPNVRVVGAVCIYEAKSAHLQARVKRNRARTGEPSSSRMIASCRNRWVDSRD